MDDIPSPKHIHEVLRDIVEGKTVKRGKHELHWGGTDLSREFIEVLLECGYRSTEVKNVNILPGERVPAFYIEHGIAYFGWVFWEKFTASRVRKLFGSTVRNVKGDWAIQIPSSRGVTLYVNTGMTYGMDLENPSGL